MERDANAIAAERVGVRRWAIDRVETGRVEPALELLESIAAATLCPLEWLRGGTVPRQAPAAAPVVPGSVPEAELAAHRAALVEREEALVRRELALAAREREQLRAGG